jgi:hypothetical protein
MRVVVALLTIALVVTMVVGLGFRVPITFSHDLRDCRLPTVSGGDYPLAPSPTPDCFP